MKKKETIEILIINTVKNFGDLFDIKEIEIIIKYQ